MLKVKHLLREVVSKVYKILLKENFVKKSLWSNWLNIFCEYQKFCRIKYFRTTQSKVLFIAIAGVYISVDRENANLWIIMNPCCSWEYEKVILYIRKNFHISIRISLRLSPTKFPYTNPAWNSYSSTAISTQAFALKIWEKKHQQQLLKIHFKLNFTIRVRVADIQKSKNRNDTQ